MAEEYFRAELLRTQIWQAEPLEILARWRDEQGLQFDALHAADGKPLATNRHFRAPRMTAEQIAAAIQPPRHAAYELAERGAAAKPELAGRMEKAAELVAGGKVKIHDPNPLNVIGTIEGYSIYADRCTCADSRYRGVWCKHRLAVRMARALGQEPEAVSYTSEAAVRERERAEQQRIAREVREFNHRDKESWRAYCNSRYGSQRYTIMAVANGATTLPPEKWQQAWGDQQRAIENMTKTMIDKEYEL